MCVSLRKCVVCGDELQAHAAAGRPRLYCGPICKMNALKPRYIGRYPYVAPSPRPSGVACGGCGQTVVQPRGRGGSKRYCDLACKRTSEKRDYLRSTGRVSLKNFKSRSGQCARCGAPINVKTNPNARPRQFCSRACAHEANRVYENSKATKRAGRHRRRARKYAAPYETFSDREIFDRDEWICGICHEPVDPVIKYPNPKSKSLDHKIPLALGGHHVRSNCQCSHFDCNSRKRHQMVCEVVNVEAS